MFKIYYASALDQCVGEAFKQIELFKGIFIKFPTIKFQGAGIGASPIISSDTSIEKKGVIVAYDLRKLRESDVLLIVTDLKTFCPGTMQEFMYAKMMGIYTLLLILNNEDKLRNIFLEHLPDKIIYSIKELEEFLEDISK